MSLIVTANTFLLDNKNNKSVLKSVWKNPLEPYLWLSASRTMSSHQKKSRRTTDCQSGCGNVMTDMFIITTSTCERSEITSRQANDQTDYIRTVRDKISPICLGGFDLNCCIRPSRHVSLQRLLFQYESRS